MKILQLFLGIIFITGPSFAQIYLDSTASVKARVQDLLARMTLEEKIGQMTQADRGSLKSTEDIKTYYLGSVLSGGGSAPAENTPTGWADLYDTFQAKALQSRLKIPLIYGIDAVHGHNNVVGAVIFPHNIGLGCTWNPELVREAARITAREVAGTGIDWTFAPCIAVPRDERWGRTYEGFGETPEITILMAAAAVSGFQGDSLRQPESIVACAKHYVGDGATTGGMDQGDAQIDEATLRAIHLPGYIAAIQSGVGTVMASFNSWNGQKLHGSKYLLTDVLKTELGFQGFIVSDWNGIDQLPGDYSSDIAQSINAGIDMVMVPDKYVTFFTGLKNLVNQGTVPLARIDDAVARILRLKFQLGLFERPYTQRSLTAEVGSATHRAVARQCVRESLVLLKKENGLLPLAKASGKILVAGAKANNLGYQCGGWTISWQGGSGAITSGTTILAGIEQASTGATVVYSADGSGVADADVAVVVVGEKPYAEGAGDRQDLKPDPEDIAVIRRVKAAGIPTVVVLISGRPLILETILHFSDVLIAAWLPGTEGDGIAEVLFGAYQPSGRLSHSWPRAMRQIPINWGDAQYQPLYPYRHGITRLADDGPETAPIFHSALLQNSGEVVEAAFSKAMAVPTANTGFFVTVNGLPADLKEVRIKPNDPNILEIALASTANAGDSLTLAYVPGQVSAADGSVLAAFEPVPVFNLRNEGSGAQAIPGRVEAENYSDMYGIQIEPTSDVGGGSNVGYIDATDWLEYDLMVSDSGRYQVSLRVAALSRAGRIGFVNNGKILAILDLPVTGGWQIWRTVGTEIPLSQGLQKLKLFAFIGGFNINWLEFALVTTVQQWSPSSWNFRLNPCYPNPFNLETTISYTLAAKSWVTVAIYNLLGQLVERLQSELQESGLHQKYWRADRAASGVYLVKLTAGSFTSTQKIVLLK